MPGPTPGPRAECDPGGPEGHVIWQGVPTKAQALVEGDPLLARDKEHQLHGGEAAEEAGHHLAPDATAAPVLSDDDVLQQRPVDPVPDRPGEADRLLPAPGDDVGERAPQHRGEAVLRASPRPVRLIEQRAQGHGRDLPVDLEARAAHSAASRPSSSSAIWRCHMEA